LLSFPALLITGHRQSGKTTFLQHAMAGFSGWLQEEIRL